MSNASLQRSERFLRDMADFVDAMRADSGASRGGGGGGGLATYSQHDVARDQKIRQDSEQFTQYAAGGILSRYDASFTAAFSRSLEYIYTQPFDVEYPALRARQLIPLDSQPNAGAEFYTYRMYDKTGRAAIVHNYAGVSFPEADAIADEFRQLIVSLGSKYSYTVQDMRAAAMAGIPLEAWKANAARFAIEKRIEEIAFSGDTSTGLVGITNAPGVQSISKVSPGSGGPGTWASQITAAIAGGTVTQTAQAILADVNAMANAIYSNTLGNHTPTTLVLPLSAYAAVMTQTRAPGFTDDTIGQYILKSSPWLNEIVDWVYANGASAGTGEAIMYEKDPEVVSLVIPQDFEQFPPEIDALRWLVYCHLRCGGVRAIFPQAIATMTGVS